MRPVHETMQSVHLSVVIPAYNEEHRLPTVLEDVVAYLDVRDYPGEVLVVDDGSTDATADVVRRFTDGSTPVELIQHPDRRNRGKGAAVRTGMLAADGRFRLFMDADNSTTIEQVENLLPAFDKGCEFAMGSRRAPGAEIRVPQPAYRNLAGQLGNLFIRLVAVPGFADTQAGFKALTAGCAEAVFSRVTIEGWAFDVEALAIARHLGFRICEVPIHWVDSSDSKLQMSDYFRVLADVVRIRKNLLLGRYD